MTNLQQKEKSSNLGHNLTQRLAWCTVNVYKFIMNVNDQLNTGSLNQSLIHAFIKLKFQGNTAHKSIK